MKNSFKYYMATAFIDRFSSSSSYITRSFISRWEQLDTSDIDDETFLYLVFSLYRKPQTVRDKILSIKKFEDISEDVWLKVIIDVKESDTYYSDENIRYFIKNYEDFICSKLPTVLTYLYLNGYPIQQSKAEKDNEAIAKRLNDNYYYGCKLIPKMLPLITRENICNIRNTSLDEIPKKYDKEYFYTLIQVCDINYDDYVNDEKLHNRIVNGITSYLNPNLINNLVQSLSANNLYNAWHHDAYRTTEDYLKRISTFIKILIDQKYPNIQQIALDYINRIRRYCSLHSDSNVIIKNVEDDFGKNSNEYKYITTLRSYYYRSTTFIKDIDNLEKLALNCN